MLLPSCLRYATTHTPLSTSRQTRRPRPSSGGFLPSEDTTTTSTTPVCLTPPARSQRSERSDSDRKLCGGWGGGGADPTVLPAGLSLRCRRHHVHDHGWMLTIVTQILVTLFLQLLSLIKDVFCNCAFFCSPTGLISASPGELWLALLWRCFKVFSNNENKCAIHVRRQKAKLCLF